MKKKTNLDLFDMTEYPREMRRYLANYGFHFNKLACHEAIKHLYRLNNATGQTEPIEAKTKEEVEQILAKNGVKLDNNTLYDFVWVYNMLASDFGKSAMEDEAHLAKGVKDMIDDPDQPDGFIFNRWISDRMFAGLPIEWADLI